MENESYIQFLETVNKKLFQENCSLKNFKDKVLECSQELSNTVLGYGLDGNSDALQKKVFIISNKLTVCLEEVKNGC